MTYTYCNYMLDSLHDLREYEEHPTTRRALLAAIFAFLDEHMRHTGQQPLLATRVIDMIDNPDDEEECNSLVGEPCAELPMRISVQSKQQSAEIAHQIMDDLGLDLLKQHSE